MNSDQFESAYSLASMTSRISTILSFRTADEELPKPKVVVVEEENKLNRIRTTEFQSLRKVNTNEIPTSSEAVMLGVCNNQNMESLARRVSRSEKKVTKSDLESESSGEIVEEEVEWLYDQGGWRAYGVIFACFMLSGIHMGWGLLQGALIAYLHSVTYPDVPLSTLNYISGLMNFSTTFSCFFFGRLSDKYGYKRMIAIGSIATFVALVLSAFTYDRLPLIFIFQGWIVGVCQGISMPVFLSLPSQYFLKRRGLMTGISASGSGFLGGIAALLMRALLPKVGYRNAMLIYAGINGLVWCVAYLLIKVRLPPLKPGQSRVPKTWLPIGIWGDYAFYSLTLCVAIGIFGYLTPFYYISIYTALEVPTLDPQSINTILPLVISNFAGGFGRIFAGLLADQFGPINTLFIAFFLGGLFQVVIWPVAHSYASIMVFAALYGLCASPTISLLPVAAGSLFGLEGLATLVGFIILMNSPGQLLGASISGNVLTASGGNYAVVAYSSGAFMILGAAVLLPARFSREKKLWVKA